MDSSAGLDTEYLTDANAEKRAENRYKVKKQVQAYRTNQRNDDLALSCELVRLTQLHTTLLEGIPVKLSLLGLLHFHFHPNSAVSLTYSDSDSVVRSRVTTDPLYEAYYEWFKELVGFVNAMCVSWGVWEGKRLAAKLRKSTGRFATLAAPGTGLTIDLLSVAGSVESLTEQPATDPVPVTALFESLAGKLLTLNKDLDFSQVTDIEEHFYPRNYVVTPSRQHIKIAPAAAGGTLSRAVVRANAAELKMHVLRRPPNPLIRCCAGEADDELKLELIRVAVTYEQFALG